MEQDIQSILVRAKEKSLRSGFQLTHKRKHILELLLSSETPLSAYQVKDSLCERYSITMPAMSVYRILNLLVAQNLAHRLSSTNQYIACSHINCKQEHETSQFLICNKCQKVREILIGKDIIQKIQKSVNSVGYTLETSQLELSCLCNSCSPSTLS